MRITSWTIASLFMGLLAISSCKKKDDTASPAVTVPTDQAQQSSDNSDVKSENDQVTSDATTVLGSDPTIGRTDKEVNAYALTSLCGITVDKSLAQSQKQITLIYDSSFSCSSPSRYRSGKIIIKLIQGNRWSEKNAVLQIKMENYKVRRSSDNKYIVLNGIKTITNVNGNDWVKFFSKTDSLVYHERGDSIIANLNGEGTQVHYIDRLSTWHWIKKADTSTVQIKAYGNATKNGETNVEIWGTNRKGLAFTSSLPQPWVADAYCEFSRPTGGQYVYKAGGNTITLTAGVNEAGVQDTRTCAYGYKIGWNLGGNIVGEKIESY